MTENFAEQFAAPGTEYRGIPFWSWNGKLEPEKLRRQIRSFRELGFGGFFMHSRVGLKTPYLGKEWFDCIRASIDEAKKQSLTPYLYDEDRWASGAAGGFALSWGSRPDASRRVPARRKRNIPGRLLQRW